MQAAKQKLVLPPPNPELEAKIAADQAEQQRQDAATRRAATEPLPGPTRDIFAIPSEIPVGNWKVRPFYDADFEFLSLLGHPLHKMMLDGIEGKPPTANANYIPRGQEAWTLCWIMTRDPEQTEAVLENGGEAELRKRARAEFRKLQFAALNAFNTAIMRQLSIYWSPSQGYGTAEGEQGGPPPIGPGSGPPLTVVGG